MNTHDKHLPTRIQNPDREQRSIVEAVISQNRSRQTIETTSVLGYQFEIHPNVFSPLTPSCSGVIGLAVAALPIWQGQSVIEFGCGSGIFACLFALAGARNVRAIDINPAARANTRRNAARHNLLDTITIQEADTLNIAISDASPIDIIYCDPPFSRYRNPENFLERAFLDPELQMARSALTAISKEVAFSEATLLLCLSSRTNIDEQAELFAEFPVTASPYIVIHDNNGQASFTLWQIRHSP